MSLIEWRAARVKAAKWSLIRARRLKPSPQVYNRLQIINAKITASREHDSALLDISNIFTRWHEKARNYIIPSSAESSFKTYEFASSRPWI